MTSKTAMSPLEHALASRVLKEATLLRSLNDDNIIYFIEFLKEYCSSSSFLSLDSIGQKNKLTNTVSFFFFLLLMKYLSM